MAFMKFKAIDLFCGAGGLSAGLKKSGFQICLGVDIDKAALNTYKHNLKNTKILKRDINNTPYSNKKARNFFIIWLPSMSRIL